jgi:hypothetical protein
MWWIEMSKPIFLIVALCALGACTHLETPLAASAGVIHASNSAAQIVSKEPAKGAPEPDSVRTAAAITRYRTDAVKTGEKKEQPLIELNLGPIP